MTQPLDTAFVEVRFDTSGSEADLKKEVDKAFAGVEKSAKDTSANVADEFAKAGESIKNTFRDVSGRLRDENGRFVKESRAGFDSFKETAHESGDEVQGIFARIRSQIKEAFGDAASAANNLGQTLGALSSAVGPIGAIVAAIGLLAGGALAASVAVQGLIVAAAGLAALPGIALAAAGGFGILAAATSGVGAAFKELNDQQKKQKTSGAGSASVQAQNQRQLANAIRDLTQAQKDVNKARQEAVRDIERLDAALKKSRASQLRSADDLAKAEKLLNDTRKVGTPEQIQEATIAYEEAKAALAGVTQTTKELEQDKKKADKAGVEGSEKVLAALERVRDAQDNVKTSQEALSRGFAAGAASQTQAFDSLSKSAQGFVKSVFDAKKALGPLQDDIQETFFKGTGDLVPGITKNILSLRGPILDVAAEFNKAFRGLLEFLASKEFKDAAASALSSLVDFLRAIGPGVKAVLKGFTGLATQIGKTGKNGKTLGETLGTVLAGALQKIGTFLSKVDLEKTFNKGKEAFNNLKPLLLATFDAVRALFRFFEEHGPGLISFFTPLVVVFTKFVNLTTEFGIKFDNALVKLQDGFTSARTKIGEFFSWVHEKWNSFVNDIKSIPARIEGLLGRIKEAGKKLIQSFFAGISAGGTFVGAFAKNVGNAIIRVFNDNIGKAINDAIHRLENTLNKIPGVNVNIPDFPRIPELAKGGLATQDTLARLGERGRKEGVIPLEDPRALSAIANAIAKAGGVDTGGNGSVVFQPNAIQVNFHGTTPTPAQAFRTGQAVGAGIASSIAQQGIRTNIRTMGGISG